MSSFKTVHVTPGDAKAISNTIPSTVTTGVIYATSVTMQNIGFTTWTSSGGFILGQSQNNTWLPGTVALSSNIAPQATHTFNFNLRHVEPEELGNNACFWRMKKSTTFFGEENGRVVFVEGSGFATLKYPWDRLFAWLAPKPAYARHFLGHGLSQGEVVQVLRQIDSKLQPGEIEAEGKYVLRYESSLAEEWPVDFQFRLGFDPSVFRLGPVTRGARGATHRIEVDETLPGDVLIRGTRTSTEGLSGSGLIIEVPLLLQEGAKAPETLPLLELVMTR